MRRCFFLLCFFISDIFLSVGSSAVQEVIAAVGASVTFPTNVPLSGTISYKNSVIGQVLNKLSDTNNSEKFMNRLGWSNQTGFFTLSDLRPDDSGLYTVQNTKEQRTKQDYVLEVYEKVSAPAVINTTSNPSEICSLLCSVRNLRGLELVWYEDGVLLNRTSSSSASASVITLNLYLDIKKTDKRTYSCVASNPVSNQTTTVDIPRHCSLNTGHKQTIVTGVVLSVFSVIAVILMCVCVWCVKRRQMAAGRQTEDRSATEGLNEEILYSVILHSNPSQPNIPERVSGEACPLTTVYDQIRPGRTQDCFRNTAE